MNKNSASEVIFYLLFYGVALLFMPFVFFIAQAILLSPLIILNSVGTIPDNISSLMNSLFPFIRTVLGIGVFLLYFILTKKLIKNYDGARVGLFTVFFISSAVINFFFSYFICAISMLKPCDPTRYLTFSGLLEIFDFYIIGLVAFILVNLYLRYTSKQPKL